MSRWPGGAALLMAGLLVGCSAIGADQSSRPHPSIGSSPVVVYAAVGASETVGVGAQNPTLDSWPQVFYRKSLPASTVYYNFGIPGATTATALTQELPQALSVRPSLVTVWLNVNDLVAGLSVSDFQANLQALIHGLRHGGASRVLVANTPYLDRLPAYLGCQSGAALPGVFCANSVGTILTSQRLNQLVDAYNLATALVAKAESAVLVDLHAQGEVPDLHPDWVSSDGFHPSTSGHAAIAEAFGAALRAQP